MSKLPSLFAAAGLSCAMLMGAAHAAHPGHDDRSDRRSERYDDRYDDRDDRYRRRSDRRQDRREDRYRDRYDDRYVVRGRAAYGEWRLDPRRCPDLREDRRDRRVTTSRRDLREDRRDERVTRCPASAWVWTGDDRRYAPQRPNYGSIYFGRDGNVYARYNGGDIRIRLAIR